MPMSPVYIRCRVDKEHHDTRYDTWQRQPILYITPRDPRTEDVHDDPAGLLIFSNSSRYDDVLAPPGEGAVECDVKPSYSKWIQTSIFSISFVSLQFLINLFISFLCPNLNNYFIHYKKVYMHFTTSFFLFLAIKIFNIYQVYANHISNTTSLAIFKRMILWFPQITQI